MAVGVNSLTPPNPMAFSLGNIIKNAASTGLQAFSPAGGALSSLYQAGKGIYDAGKTALAGLSKPASSPSNSLFTATGPTTNGVIPSGAAQTPNFIVPTAASTPTIASPTLKSSTPTAAVPTQVSSPAPVVPSTIPSDLLSSGGNPVATVTAPVVPTPATTPFTSTAQNGASGGTPGATTTAPPPTPGTPGSASVADLVNPSSDAQILDTQGRITNINTQLQGKASALAAEQIKARVPEQQQQLNDVMSQINTLNNQAVAEQVKIEGKPIASEFQQRQIGAVERARVVKVLGLSATAAALQGNLALANDYANKAVEAKFAPLEAELTTLKQQLEFNKDNFTRAEKTRADKLAIALDDRQQALTDAREKAKNINSIALEAAKSGADAETLNAILGTDSLADALGAARASLAKKNGIGIYNLSEAQANIASKLADDFEKATGTFSSVRDAYGRIQASRQGTGIGDTSLIFSYMKMLDPSSVVREGEFATVQNASGIPQKVMQAYNQALNGQKLADSVRNEIYNTSNSLFQKAQETQGVVTKQYNDRAIAYGIPTDLVTRDVSAGIGNSGAPGATGGATRDTITVKLKAKYPDASDADIQVVAQKYLDNPELQAQLGFSNDLGTSQNSPQQVRSGAGFRTDRHNNPTAFTTDVARAAGLKEGVDYTIGDPFPDNASLKTARLIGDPIDTTIKVIDRISFQTSSGKPRWNYINMPKSQWDALSYAQKKNVIQQMYQHEGGSALSSVFA